MTDSISESIASDAQIHLAASDFTADIAKYLWPMDVYWDSFHAKVKFYRAEGLTQDADLLHLHIPVMDDGLVCFADHDEPMRHEQCPVVRHLWPEVHAAYEQMCRSFRDCPMTDPTTNESGRTE